VVFAFADWRADARLSIALTSGVGCADVLPVFPGYALGVLGARLTCSVEVSVNSFTDFKTAAGFAVVKSHVLTLDGKYDIQAPSRSGYSYGLENGGGVAVGVIANSVNESSAQVTCPSVFEAAVKVAVL
jgi:hypothetical protein